MGGDGAHRVPVVQQWARRAYVLLVRRFVPDPLAQQRLKLLWVGFGYLPFLGRSVLPLAARIRLVGRFLRVDWCVEHGHKPGEMARILRALAARRGHAGEVVVEAGCWKGGSTAKFSLVARELGLRLEVFDSFAGVEPMAGVEAGEYDFSGEFASPESEVRANVTRLGAPEVCGFHAGWFADTLAARPVADPVRMVYVDCDLAKGTVEVLRGTVGALVTDALVYSQDTHIPSVRDAVTDPALWHGLGVDPPPKLRHLAWDTGVLEPAGGRWPTHP